MDFREISESWLSDYSDFSDEFAELLGADDPSSEAPGAVDRTELKLIDAIDVALNRASNSADAQLEFSTGEIGQLPGYSRTAAIMAVITLVMGAVGRRSPEDRIKSPLIGPVLYYIALWSDNCFGRCTHGARRIAQFVGCSERYLRSVLIQCIAEGLVRCEVRPGQTPALWLPYNRAAVAASAVQVSEAIAPPSANPGRPSSGTKPRNSCVPGFTASNKKTPEVASENPGTGIDKPRNSSGSATKTSSMQDLKVMEVRRQQSRSQRDALDVFGDDGLVSEKAISFVFGDPRISRRNPSRAQREKAADALTKAALQWKVPGKPQAQYETFQDWFRANWIPGLLRDLSIIEDRENRHHRFEDQCVGEPDAGADSEHARQLALIKQQREQDASSQPL